MPSNDLSQSKALNIIYGRNYSGKTTLSRIFKSIEDKKINKHHTSGKFSLTDMNDVVFKEESTECPYTVRVYNKDFVRENLRCLHEDNGDIQPFAVLGKQNIEVEKKIAECETTLGSEESKAGLKHELSVKDKEYNSKKDKRIDSEKSLEGELRAEAKRIKENRQYNDTAYDITKIKKDIKVICDEKGILLDESEVKSLEELLKETVKSKNLEILDFPLLNFPVLYDEYKSIVNKKVSPTNSIKELLDDEHLQEWVRTGIKHHENKRDTCAFCNNQLDKDLWGKLKSHFNIESESHRQEILTFIEKLNAEINSLTSFSLPDKQEFYTPYQEKYEEIKSNLIKEIKLHKKHLSDYIKDLEKKEKNVFSENEPIEKKDNAEKMDQLVKKICSLIESNKNQSISLSKDQERAKSSLRLNEIALFKINFGYEEKEKRLETLRAEEKQVEDEKKELVSRIKKIEAEIEKLKILQKDESQGADKINEYLCHHFGQCDLKLSAIEDDEAGTKFKIYRGDEEAENLSEGECSLIAFCYFVASLERVGTKRKDLVIWIDDPISSLDNNHIFFVYSLIENVIAKPKKDPNGKLQYLYKQLFISTHSLDFLQYIRKLTRKGKKAKALEEFIVESESDDRSTIKLMPEYLRKYVTEFNYLFNQIYLCSGSDSTTDHHVYYNFGNNLRKFLEAYLFYKYPDSSMKIKEKIKLFFENDKIAVDINDRINNEYSHLQEMFDRSLKPIDTPEMPRLASYVLNKIKNKDKEQYEALLRSISESS